MLETFHSNDMTELYTEHNQQRALQKLESGHVLFLPDLSFTLAPDEKLFLTPEFADPASKNIGYYPTSQKLWGVQRLTDEKRHQLKAMLHRYSQHCLTLLQHLLPTYHAHLMMGRTSFRPIQVSGRKTSNRKDDKRLHVDAFPSSPNQGKRILRIFCNINPTADRVWRLGEPFEDVAQRFIPKISKPFPGSSALLQFLQITKTPRSPYDHYMLQLHDRMKEDDGYQQNAQQQEVRFPPASTWIVQTDHVSHAAMEGQHVLEQTFYLPIHAMQNPDLSPQRVLEKMLNKPLA